MDLHDYFTMGTHVPAFGSWDSGEYLEFTECFDSAREAGLLNYTDADYQDYEEQYNDDEEEEEEEGDLYVTGDLYQKDVVTSAVIIVPSNRSTAKRRAAKAKKQSRWEPDELSNWPQRNTLLPVKAAKPVDEDLYRISPELLHKMAKKKRGPGFFASCCLVPACFM